ncbi:MAG TPA: hypothetical protein VGV38_16950 [Pyrinomonadaceae bacterium]|nr:hypothetical protein [Pyrinomonadaceae bacterium]
MGFVLQVSSAEKGAGQESSRSDAEGGRGAGESAARELGVWLCALESFFRLRNHPLTEAEREELPSRNFAAETRVAQAGLLRCSQLAYALQAAPAEATQAENPFGADATVGTAEDDAAGPDATDGVAALRETFGDAWTTAQALLKGGAVGLQEWAGLGRTLARELEAREAARELVSEARRPSQALQTELSAVAERLMPDSLGASVANVFSRLALLLERLRFVEELLRRDQPLKQALPVFTLVHEEARELLELIESRALASEGVGQDVFDVLDGTAYAVRMELRKTFEHELAGLLTLRPATHVYAKVEAAHGLLRDCFQQSTVSLAQVFNPSLDGARLFEAFQTKLEQSLALRHDLWALLDLARRAEQQRERRHVAQMLEQLSTFRESSMRFLMYKDWESFERFVEELHAARGAVELGPVIHRFTAYLETLFGQVNMRAVLADKPFDFPAAEA